MLRIVQQHLVISSLAAWMADSVICFVAVMLAAATMALLPFAAQAMNWTDALATALGFALLMSFSCALVGLYRQDRLAHGLRAVLSRAMLAIMLGALVAYLVTLQSSHDRGHEQLIIVFAVAYLTTGLLLARGAAFSARRALVGVRRVLIVGTGSEAWALASDLRSRARAEFCVVGFYPTGTVPANESHRPGVFANDLSLQDVVRRHRVDEIIVAVREQRGGSMPLEQLLACRIQGIPVSDTAGFYERAQGVLRVDNLKASALVYGQGFIQQRSRIITKRVFDVFCASVLLALSAPVMALTALLIKLDSRGPVLKGQERMGLAGRRFTLWTFRTELDKRPTRIGLLLRQMRIHRLPELLCVLSGAMSMVGPRATDPDTATRMTLQLPFYAMRHSVKPGFVGWAKVRQAVTEASRDARQEHQYDLYYVKNNSLALDLQVLIESLSWLLFR